MCRKELENVCNTQKQYTYLTHTLTIMTFIHIHFWRRFMLEQPLHWWCSSLQNNPILTFHTLEWGCLFLGGVSFTIFYNDGIFPILSSCEYGQSTYSKGFFPKEIDYDFSFPLPTPKASLGPTSFNVDVSFERLWGNCSYCPKVDFGSIWIRLIGSFYQVLEA